jgi:hypothetical protein
MCPSQCPMTARSGSKRALSVRDIFAHSASDPHVCLAQRDSAKPSLVRDYLDCARARVATFVAGTDRRGHP